MSTAFMFGLERPCANCPFRIGQGSLFRMARERIEEIIAASAFQCHKTVNYDDIDDEYARQGTRPQQCAGLMALLHREGCPNQIMQVAQRLTGFDASNIESDDVYTYFRDAFTAHCDGAEPANA